MESKLELYKSLNRLWKEQEKAMDALQIERLFRPLGQEAFEDCMKALKDNRETADELIAHFDHDSVEYAIRNQIPY